MREGRYFEGQEAAPARVETVDGAAARYEATSQASFKNRVSEGLSTSVGKMQARVRLAGK